jgi:uncharacterized protein (TIGR03435 family)
VRFRFATRCGLLAIACGSCVAAEFEAASVKPHIRSGAVDERAGIEEDQSLVKIDNLSLRVLIGMAWKVKTFQIAGPAWLDADTFDIVARPPQGYQRDQLPGLLEALLIDRFKVAAHHESRSGAAYALVISKAGSKLRETTGPRTYLTGRPGLIEGNQRSIAELKDLLAGVLERPVEDHTGLTGKYDLKLEWNAAELTSSNSQANDRPSLFSALQEQMGLKLERITAPVDFVVVDHAQRLPVAN